MKVRALIVIMSQLSDVQEALGGIVGNPNGHYAHTKLNFAKWLLIKHPDTSVEIDADEEYKLFCKERKV